MKFKIWLENNNSLLFLVHPNFAVENWSTGKYALQLKNYYESVKKYADSFQGQVVMHLFEPYNLDQIDEINKTLYKDFIKWTKNSKFHVIWEEKLGSSFGNIFDDLLMDMSNNSTLYIGGGYLNSCLNKTVQMLEDQYGSYIKENNINIEIIPELVYVPGCSPHSLHEKPDNEYQLKNTRDQMKLLPTRFRWKNIY